MSSVMTDERDSLGATKLIINRRQFRSAGRLPPTFPAKISDRSESTSVCAAIGEVFQELETYHPKPQLLALVLCFTYGAKYLDKCHPRPKCKAWKNILPLT